jgi:hypothetical protein
MTSRTDKISVGNSRAAYMRECRKRNRTEVTDSYSSSASMCVYVAAETY